MSSRLAIFSFFDENDKRIGGVITVAGSEHYHKMEGSGYTSHAFNAPESRNRIDGRAELEKLKADETPEAHELLNDYIEAAEQREADDWSRLEPGTVQWHQANGLSGE